MKNISKGHDIHSDQVPVPGPPILLLIRLVKKSLGVQGKKMNKYNIWKLMFTLKVKAVLLLHKSTYKEFF